MGLALIDEVVPVIELCPSSLRCASILLVNCRPRIVSKSLEDIVGKRKLPEESLG